MTKFVILLVISAVVIATYALTKDPSAAALLGAAVALGTLFALHFFTPKTQEVTSDLPTFLPRTLAERQAEAIRIATTPVEDEGELLPPAPNMGDFGTPYRGPQYF